MREPPSNNLQRLKKSYKSTNPKSLKESIDITFIENGPVVSEYIKDKKTKRH